MEWVRSPQSIRLYTRLLGGFRTIDEIIALLNVHRRHVMDALDRREITIPEAKGQHTGTTQCFQRYSYRTRTAGQSVLSRCHN